MQYYPQPKIQKKQQWSKKLANYIKLKTKTDRKKLPLNIPVPITKFSMTIAPGSPTQC